MSEEIGRGGIVVKLFASPLGEPGSISNRGTPRFSHPGIVLDDATGRRVSSGISRFRRPFFFSDAAPYSHHFTLIDSRDIDVKSSSSHSALHSLLRTVFASSIVARPLPAQRNLFSVNVGSRVSTKGLLASAKEHPLLQLSSQARGTVPFQATPHATFQQENARPHGARNVQVFFNERRVPLLPWPARSPEMSPLKDMVGRPLVHHGPPATTVDAVWTRIQTVWREIPQEHIQVLFDSVPRRFGALIAERETIHLPHIRIPAVSLPDFRMRESCRTIPLVGGFSRDLSFPPSMYAGAAPHSHRFTFIGSQDLDFKSRPNLSTPFSASYGTLISVSARQGLNQIASHRLNISRRSELLACSRGAERSAWWPATRLTGKSCVLLAKQGARPDNPSSSRSPTSVPMRVIEVSMEQHRNEGEQANRSPIEAPVLKHTFSPSVANICDVFHSRVLSNSPACQPHLSQHRCSQSQIFFPRIISLAALFRSAMKEMEEFLRQRNFNHHLCNFLPAGARFLRRFRYAVVVRGEVIRKRRVIVSWNEDVVGGGGGGGGRGRKQCIHERHLTAALDSLSSRETGTAMVGKEDHRALRNTEMEYREKIGVLRSSTFPRQFNTLLPSNDPTSSRLGLGSVIWIANALVHLGHSNALGPAHERTAAAGTHDLERRHRRCVHPGGSSQGRGQASLSSAVALQDHVAGVQTTRAAAGWPAPSPPPTPTTQGVSMDATCPLPLPSKNTPTRGLEGRAVSWGDHAVFFCLRTQQRDVWATFSPAA
ncbi:hypothetical protein PR048_030463 [Dryococelus australis]|uniref:Uncharacterized protein n=1 Tax=Dryococelus australis TaxID=614101 RepID=A0ABQ9G9U9_9NEOP|nr:hypothetical protein PR048_030463 [Dryococelus australis]